MATERIKLIELDINVDNLIKKGADSQEQIKKLKTETKFLEKSMKEGATLLKSYENDLKRLESQGKKNSKEYNDRKKTLETLSASHEKKKQKLEATQSAIRKEQNEYRKTKKAIDAYNTTVQQEIGFIEKTDGSIIQLGAALAHNRQRYRELTKEQRENEQIGGRLVALINEQDEEFKELNRTIGVTQVDVGNYKNAIKEALIENTNLNKSVEAQISKIPVLGGLLTALYQVLVKYISSQYAAAMATSGTTKALKLLRLAFMGTGIGALVVLIASLIAYLTTTQSGIDKVNKVLIPLKTILQSLLGVLQKVGEALFDTFSDPKQAVKDLWETIKTNLVNRVVGLGDMFKAVAKIISSGFTDGYKDFANATLKTTTGIEDVIGKTQNLAGQTADFFSEAYKRGEKISEIQQQLSASEADFILKMAENKEQFKAQNKIAEDQTKTLAEREAAAQKSIEILKDTNEEQRKRNELELELLRIKTESNDTSDADRAEIARKVAELKEANASMLEAETTQQNKLNTIRKEAYNKAEQQRKEAAQRAKQARERRINEELKSSKIAIDRYVLENQDINATLKERLKYYQDIYDEEKKLLDAQLKYKKITQEEYDLAILQNQKETAQRIAEASTENLTKELDLYIAQNKSKIEENTKLTDEIVKEEERRLETLYEKRLEMLEQQRTDELISEQDFLIQKLNLQADYLEQQKELEDQVKEQKEEEKELEKELEQENYDNNLEIRRLRGESEFELRKEQLERQKKLEVEQAKKKGLDVEKVEEKYAERKKKIDEEYNKTKIAALGATLNVVVNLIGKESAVGKAAALTQALINTYQGITAGVKLGWPLAIPAVAYATATGFSAVKNITKLEQGGYLEGKSHTQGGIPFTIAGQPGFEAEGGEYIVNRRATALFRPLLESINSQYNIRKTRTRGLFQNGGIVTSQIAQPQIQNTTSTIDNTGIQEAVREGARQGTSEAEIMITDSGIEGITTRQAEIIETSQGANI